MGTSINRFPTRVRDTLVLRNQIDIALSQGNEVDKLQNDAGGDSLALSLNALSLLFLTKGLLLSRR